MKQLSNLDASFLHLETNHAPMHVGCLLIFKQPSLGKLTYENFCRHIESRLQTSPIFRQRLVRSPLDLDLPYWVQDSKFCLANHVSKNVVRRVVDNRGALHSGEAPTASTDVALHTQRFMERKLNRRHPLWEMRFMEAKKNDGYFAVAVKVHHAAIDGVSGEEVLLGILDFTEQPKQLAEDTWEPDYRPTRAAMITTTVLKSIHEPKRMAELARQTAEKAKTSIALRKTEKEQPPLFFDSPPTPFNVPVKGRRVFVNTQLPLQKIKRVKNSVRGYTVNDVILAVCAGALKKYLDEKGALPDKSVVAMAPVSTRKNNDNPTGNSVSSMCVALATDIDNPLERLAKIHSNCQQSKKYNRKIAAEELLDMTQPAAFAYGIRAYTKLGLGRFVKPIFNVIITNVPGSPVPLYLKGGLLVSQAFMAPVSDYAGLTIAVTSYRNDVTISLTTTDRIVPDAQNLLAYMRESLDELCGLLPSTEPDNTSKRKVLQLETDPA